MLLCVFCLGACGVNNLPSYDAAVNAAWHALLSQYEERVTAIDALLDSEAWNHIDDVHRADLRSTLTRVQLAELTPKTLTDPAALNVFERDQRALAKHMHVIADTAASVPDPALQRQLAAVLALEAPIDAARRDYSEAQRRYNTELRTAPGRWWHQVLYPDLRAKAALPAAAAE